MTVGKILQAFFSDGKVAIALLLITLDFLFGVLSALKKKTFRFAYMTDFLRNDFLFKLVPYLVVYSAALVAGHQHWVFEDLDMGLIAGVIYGGLIVAWSASIVNSLLELGLAPQLKERFATDLSAAPPQEGHTLSHALSDENAPVPN